LILAAGFVKGDGFESEGDALQAVRRRQNIIPGWRALPALLGPVEFGSFTRYPRLGNPGTVLWRDAETRSTQNRVGLKNPGAVGAAAFLFERRGALPPVFGVNIAPSPGVDDPGQERDEVIEAMRAFIARGVRPAWFTLNLSCPNTEDDPGGRQTEDHARTLCAAVTDFLADYVGGTVPLWVKVSPCLSDAQYQALMAAFAETGVRAVIATNTLGQPTPDDPALMAGVGGGRLHDYAVAAAATLADARRQNGYPVDVIGCGGVQDPATYHAFARHGVRAVQYWSALVFGGPLAPAQILEEINV
jgi:dihydroorotate dehydrogenase